MDGQNSSSQCDLYFIEMGSLLSEQCYFFTMFLKNFSRYSAGYGFMHHIYIYVCVCVCLPQFLEQIKNIPATLQ